MHKKVGESEKILSASIGLNKAATKVAVSWPPSKCKTYNWNNIFLEERQ